VRPFHEERRGKRRNLPRKSLVMKKEDFKPVKGERGRSRSMK